MSRAAAPQPPPGPDDFRRRRRRVAQQVLADLRDALQADEISDHAVDSAIAALQTVQAPDDDATSDGGAKLPAHQRSVSDPNMPLTIWMRLRHSAKPTRAYRVQTPDALSSVTPLGAIDASLILPNVARGVSDTKLRQLVLDHINGSHSRSPFISIFTAEAHARQWAVSWSSRNAGEVCNLLALDVGKITRLFSVRELVARLGVDPAELAHDGWEDEYLVVHQIPSEAIVKKRKMRSPPPRASGEPGEREREREREGEEDSGADEEAWSSNVLRRSITIRHANGLALPPADLDDPNAPTRPDLLPDDEPSLQRLISSYQLGHALQV